MYAFNQCGKQNKTLNKWHIVYIPILCVGTEVVPNLCNPK